MGFYNNNNTSSATTTHLTEAERNAIGLSGHVSEDTQIQQAVEASMHEQYSSPIPNPDDELQRALIASMQTEEGYSHRGDDLVSWDVFFLFLGDTKGY